MEGQMPSLMMGGRGSKRESLLRIIRDLQRFNEDQLKILISMAHKVRSAKRSLALVAETAEQLMFSMPTGGKKSDDRTGIKQIEEPIPEITKH